MSMPTQNSIRTTLSAPLFREGFLLLLFLFAGSHAVGHVGASVYLSKGAVIPIATGLVVGCWLRRRLGERRDDWSDAGLVLVVSALGIVASWVVAAALFGDAGKSIRIPGFVLAVLLGSVLVRAR